LGKFWQSSKSCGISKRIPDLTPVIFDGNKINQTGEEIKLNPSSSPFLQKLRPWGNHSRLKLLLISVVLFSGVIFSGVTVPKPGALKEYRRVNIQTGKAASAVEKKVARLLMERLQEAGIEHTRIRNETEPTSLASDELLILLGVPERHQNIACLFQSQRIPALTELAPGPEGFLLQMVKDQANLVLLAAGVDDRGCLYAVEDFGGF